MAERRPPTDRELDLRILEARILTTLAMMAVGRYPTAHEVAYRLPKESGAEVFAALERLAAEGRIAVESEPDPNLPLIAPPIVRYRPLALIVGSKLPEGGGR